LRQFDSVGDVLLSLVLGVCTILGIPMNLNIGPWFFCEGAASVAGSLILRSSHDICGFDFYMDFDHLSY
jgi:hypothetical protein